MKHFSRLVKNIFLTLIITTGCDTDTLHDMNINPNAVNEMDMNFFFTAACLGSASNGTYFDNRYTDWRANIVVCGHALQQLATLATYDAGAGDKYWECADEPTSAPFQYFFVDVGRETNEIIRQTSPGGFSEGRIINTHHAARILRVLCFHRLTDWYGNIPYFEANSGIEGVFFPKYDKQKDIYINLLKELDEACAGLSASNPDEGFAAADIIFKGDIAKWKKWGYSLMLRLAMRVSNVDAAMANTYVTKAIAGGVMNSNDDNVWVPTAIGPRQWVNQNGISRAFYPGDGGQPSFLSKTFIDWLMGPDKTSVADDDPRLMILSGGIAMWTPNSWLPYPGGEEPLNQIGMPNGLDQAMIDALYGYQVIDYQTFSRINFKMLQYDEPYQIMNAAESQFLMAEALERGIGSGIPGTAEEHYNAGVKMAMQLYTKYDPSLVVTDERVAQYLALYPYSVTKPALEMIGEQMWASKFMNWWDAWSDWRRTGYPVLTPVNYPGNFTNGQIPTKFIIPATEASSNYNYFANDLSVGATQPDRLYGKVWWDGGPE